MEVIPWSFSGFLNVSHSWLPELSPGDLHYYGQIPALNDCLYRYMYQTKYMGLHDKDELILPRLKDSWKELLPVLEKVYGADRCYMFENNVFPNTIVLPPPNSQTPQHLNSRWQGVSGVNILDHLFHEPTNNKWANFKTIVNPRAVITPTVHGVLHSQNGCASVNRNIARMYHTR
ncbi:hypothetical protein LDENG_00242500 [Lucifuga dentata]|nr:hypothetical protein LDENG_00242500 [Lucifuga dentata]